MSEIITKDWKAWINRMPGSSSRGTLHVTGDVDTQSTDLALLDKTVPQGINSRILLLTLHVETGTVPVKNPQTVTFTEDVGDENPYDRIDILHQGEIVASIEDIPEVQ